MSEQKPENIDVVSEKTVKEAQDRIDEILDHATPEQKRRILANLDPKYATLPKEEIEQYFEGHKKDPNLRKALRSSQILLDLEALTKRT